MGFVIGFFEKLVIIFYLPNFSKGLYPFILMTGVYN